ncbi:MAG TPA: hypothetical protein VMG59_03145 [Phycisphaerae bacterium]|nr:hypothetical protein [Phycisphaerae bacterium]
MTMNFTASVSLDFLGQQDFAWWTIVVGILSISLIGYGLWQIRQNYRAKSTAAESGGATAGKFPIWALSAGTISAAWVLCAAFFAPARSFSAGLILTTLTASLAVWLFYGRVFDYLGWRRISILFLLRVLSVLFLILLLFEPEITWVEIPRQVSTLGIVIDASGSMSVNDQPNEPSRYLQSVLAAKLLIDQLQGRFNVECFAYDGKHDTPLASPDVWSSIAPDGTMTDLPQPIQAAVNAGAKQIVLFSDGIQNGPTAISTIADLDVPVYPVRVGSTTTQAQGVPDVEIVRVDGPQTAPVNTEITLTVSIRSSSLNDRTVNVSLMQDSRQLDLQRLVLHSGTTPQTVTLKFTPDKVGRLVLQVQIPVLPDQRSSAGNQQQFPILITNPRIAVLYIEGRVRPEVGPLQEDLATDPNVNLVSLIQTRPGYFMVRGQQADLSAAPTTLQQWEQFKVIMLGDISASFFTAQQQEQIRQTVQDGAGLLMIGGMQNFASGGWGQSPLAPALPADLSTTEPAQLDTPFVPQLTAFGQSSSIFDGITGWFIPPSGGQPQFELPPLAGCTALAGVRPGAEVLLTNPTAQVNGNPAIVLAVEHYGKGLSAAFAGDTTYRWQLSLRTMGLNSPYNRFWGQLIRWVADQSSIKTAQGPSVLAMLRRERFDPGEPVDLQAEVTDEHGQLTQYASAWADITGPDSRTQRIQLYASDTSTGMYENNFTPAAPGKYHATFSAVHNGQKLGEDMSDFYVAPPVSEMDNLAADPKTLQEIASRTGGSYSELADIPLLARRLQAALPPENQVKRTSLPLYQDKLFFLLFVAALTVEWFLRRKWQLQ